MTPSLAAGLKSDCAAVRDLRAALECRVATCDRLTDLANVARQAQCVVGVDTGLTHLAVALNVPVTGLYCGSDPALTGLHGGKWVRNLGNRGTPPAVADVMRALEPVL